RPKQASPLERGDGHPIAVVAERTGLTQDVLRVWERRYGAVKPERGATGQRLYTDADVDRLRLLHAATRAGRGIGQIARLSGKILARMVEEDAAARATLASSADSLDAAELVDAGLVLTRSLDAPKLDDHLRRAAALMGVSAFLRSVAAPLLRRVGDEWHAGRLTPAQEHLASSVLHDIIVTTMRGFAQRNGAPRVLVATPAGERHAIGAALLGASAAIQGWNVIYLGADLPSEEIAAAAIAANADVVALSILYLDDRKRVLGELRSLRSRLPATIGLLVGGSGAAPLKPDLSEAGVRVGASVADLDDELRRGARPS
ncbi:MAG TPA: MerR family transcriptional regulator, partial [Gemmatimonadaceae bacterium]|nr:MerR family transcriptional regulator [Gemmatimonadaceae bacterium]